MTRKTATYVFGAVLAGGFVAVFFLLNRTTSNALEKDEEPAYRLSASRLIDAFATDESTADSMYSGKVLEIHGRLTRIIDDEGTKIWIIGDSMRAHHISCYMEPVIAEKVSAPLLGSDVRVKGVCNGMLSDIILDKAIVLNE